MAKSFRLPKTEEELEDREVEGLWRAIALAKKIGESRDRITIAALLDIHKTIFEHAAPSMAGRFRKQGEDIKKLNRIEPPLGSVVEERMYIFWQELDTRLAVIPLHSKAKNKTQYQKWFNQILDVATWAQHQIAAIHPFCDGNGRTARLLTNVILSRFRIPPSQVKYDKKEDKEAYLAALGQADMYGDYEPLRAIIVRGVVDSYKKEQVIRARKRAEG